MRNFERQKELSMFEIELKKIDTEMESVDHRDLPQLFNKVPLDVFGRLLLDVPPQYSYLKSFFLLCHQKMYKTLGHAR